MRFYELAKEHGLTPKVLLEQAQAAGFEIKNSLQTVDDALAAWVREQVAGGGVATAEETQEKKPAKKAAKKPAKKSDKKKAKPVEPEAETAEEAEEPEAKASEAPASGTSSAEAEEAPAAKPKKKVKKPQRKKRRKLARGTAEETAESAESAESAAAAEGEESGSEGGGTEAAAAAPEETASAEGTAETSAETAAEGETGEEEVPEDAEAAAIEVEKPEKEEEKEDKSAAKPHRRKGRRGEEEEEEEEFSGRRKRRSDSKSKSAKAARHLAEPEEDLEAEPIPEAQPLGEEVAEEVRDELLVHEEEEEEEKTGHKHKRADFKSLKPKRELPAIFADISPEYTRSVASAGKGRRPSRGGAGRRRGRIRSRRSGPSVKRERDPNAIATVSPGMTVREVSVALGVKLNDILAFLMRNGTMANVNDILPEEEIALIATEFDIKIEWKGQEDLEERLQEDLDAQEEAAQENLRERPPIITFLGHVDHGKTSLLDRIRASRVAAGEAGGITQHIGAYTVEQSGHQITFLDTPGHQAFTAMRARGADVTDITVLVVAADDGVMPQTEEAVSHARNAGVPIVVAINKCDLPGANPDRVRQELATRLELLPEAWGGQVGMIEVSAMTGEGIDELLERILLEAEILELQANPDRPASGFVIEAQMTENRGVVATVLVTDGTLHRGDVILCSSGYGKVKLMYDHQGRTLEEVPPATPVSLTGLNNVPEAGDKIYVLDDILRARAIAEEREHQARSAALSKRKHVTLENLRAHLDEGEVGTLNVIVKADVMGSLEVLQKTLDDLSTEEVRINVIHSAVGGINQADILLADASDAVVVGFHVVADQEARLQSASYGVQVKIYHIIYRLVEDMRAALEGMLPPEEREIVQGHLEVRDVFKASRVGTIAGCFVTDGTVTRNSRLRLIRDSVVIYDGKIGSLKRFKDDAREVRQGFECGLKIEGYDDVKIGDTLEAYVVEEVARKLES